MERLIHRIIGVGIIVLAIGYYTAFILDCGKEYHKLKLEIYTPENIYYINGLEVTNEADEEVITFSSMEGLKNYISTITAHDTNGKI